VGVRWPLAFSTLGCSGWPLSRVVELAEDSNWSGLELRVAPEEPVHLELTAAERAEARRVLSGGRTEPLALASYVKVGSGVVGDGECVADALRHAGLAADLGCPWVRVFPGAETPGPSADERMARRLATAAEQLPAGVELLLETHDSHPRGADVARVLALVDSPRVRAIWDVLHPWRTGEPIAETARVLAPYLAHVQVKDVRSATELTPLPLGAGAVPLAELLRELEALGYDGHLSLEWERKWYPQALPLPEALAVSTAWLATSDEDPSRRC
jgi:sugar phosphate isomerase/epimerase